MDTPGLDDIQERQNIRSGISDKIKADKIEIDGILYVVDPTKRDPLDPKKILNFIKQLPYANSKLK